MNTGHGGTEEISDSTAINLAQSAKSTDLIHFKISHEGVTRRFALSRGENDLMAALKARVLKFTNTEDVSLFWKDEDSLIIIECVEDLEAAVDYAETRNRLGCVVIETGEKIEGEVSQTEVVQSSKAATAIQQNILACVVLLTGEQMESKVSQAEVALSSEEAIARSNEENFNRECAKMSEKIEKGVNEFRSIHLDIRKKKVYSGRFITEEDIQHDRQLIETFCKFYRLQNLNFERKRARNDTQRAAAEALIKRYSVETTADCVKKSENEVEKAAAKLKSLDFSDETGGQKTEFKEAATNYGTERTQSTRRLESLFNGDWTESAIRDRFEHGGIDFLQWMIEGGIRTIADDELSCLYYEYAKERFSIGEIDVSGIRGAKEALREVCKERGGRRMENGFGCICLSDRGANSPFDAYEMGGLHFNKWVMGTGLKKLRDREEKIALYRKYEEDRFAIGEVDNSKMSGAMEVLERNREEKAYRNACEQVQSVLNKISWEKASQIPAHMAIAVIEEVMNLTSIEDMDDKLSEYLEYLCNNTFEPEPHALIFADGREDYLTGNIAVDLEKHLENIQKMIRSKTHEDALKMLDERSTMLREALRQNRTDGEEYVRIAKELHPILLTSDYTRIRPSSGCWDEVYYGFMEVDPARGYGIPPRVASADPINGGLFALRSGLQYTYDRSRDWRPRENYELAEKEKALLRELYKAGNFRDYAKMYKVCRTAKSLDEAMNMMLQ